MMIDPVSSAQSIQGIQDFEPLRNAHTSIEQRHDIPSDTNAVRAPHLLNDGEADMALASVEQSLFGSAADALSVHGGLDLDRVMALLAE